MTRKVHLRRDAHEAVTFSGAPSLGRGRPWGERESNEQCSVRRSTVAVRRFTVAHRLVHLFDLTLAPSSLGELNSRSELLEAGSRMLRTLGRRIGHPFPYLMATEGHASDARPHLNLLVPDLVTRGQVRELWRHGFFDVRVAGAGRGREVDDLRSLAAYFSKEFQATREAYPRTQLYRAPQGFKVIPESFEFDSWFAADAFVRSEASANLDVRHSAGSDVYSWS